MEDSVQAVLDICHEVRRLLVENGVKNLGMDFPIKQWDGKSTEAGETHDNHYLGWAHLIRDDWELVDKHHMVAKSNITRFVEVCLVDNQTKELYPLEMILPTLLHEFAHCTTPGLRTYGVGDKREWTSDSHDEHFYDNFAIILDVAEKLGIYKLNSHFTKNNRQSLRRFDAVDVDGKNVFMGTTTRYAQLENSDYPPAQKLQVANEKGETKLIVLNRVTKDKLLEQLKDGCVRKFNIKKKKAILNFFTQQGTIIEDGDTLCKCAAQKEQIIFRIT